MRRRVDLRGVSAEPRDAHHGVADFQVRDDRPFREIRARRPERGDDAAALQAGDERRRRRRLVQTEHADKKCSSVS
eukprot:30931-Pelagococcus_subviridis.AAC.9